MKNARQSQHTIRRDVSNLLSLLKIISSRIEIDDPDIREMIELSKMKESELIHHLNVVSDFIHERGNND